MLSALPNELIELICKNLDIISINNLRYSNSYLYKTINHISPIILKNELQKTNKKSSCYIQQFITNFCKIILYKNLHLSNLKEPITNDYYYNIFVKNLNQNEVHYTSSIIKNYTNYLTTENIQSINLYNISYNKNVNNLFKNVLTHYIYEESLLKYDKINLFILYNFIQIEQFNVSHLNYYIEFIENLTLNRFTNIYDDIVINYYKFIVKNLNYEDSFMYSSEHNYQRHIDFLTLEQLYKISKWIITPHLMQKLLTYKPLNLNNSELLICCNLCCRRPIDEIVTKKFNLRNDELTGYNYSEFKNLIYNNTDKYLVNYILIHLNKKQKKLVNKYIYITDPVTNQRKRFKYSGNIDYKTLNIINKNQNYLIKKIFD